MGDNHLRQLADGTNTDRNFPVCMSDRTTSAFYGKKMNAVATGNSHALSLDSDGRVYAWGWNDYGQLGDGETYTYGGNNPEIITVSTENNQRIVSISAGWVTVPQCMRRTRFASVIC
jgi:alpha-tubulin suppressor-like RCC1 family protein